jgi:hypothetical protein
VLRRFLFRRVPHLVPIFRVFAVLQVALLARRHLAALDGSEWRRLLTLVRRGRSLTPAERAELRALAAKVEPRAFAVTAAQRFSPVPLPWRLLRGR